MKTTGASLIRLKSKFRFLFIFILAIIAATITFVSAMQSLEDNLSEEIGNIAKQKSEAEEFVRILKVSHTNKKTSDQEFERGQTLYGYAEAAFNGWIAKMQYDLVRGRSTEPPEETKLSLQNAVQKSERFNSYVDELVCGKTRWAGVVAATAGLVAVITDAAIKIYQEYRKANIEDRKRLIEELEKLKWKPFNQIS